MTTTETRPEIDETPAPTRTLPVHGAITRVMEEVRAVAKTGEYNASGVRYNFRGVDAVVNAVGPALRAHGVVMVPHKTEVSYREVAGHNRTMRECTVKVTYRIYGPRGDWIEVEVPGESLDSSDKGTAKAMSVALRIAMLQTFTLPTDSADPDDERPERAAPAAKRDDRAVAVWIAAFEQRVDEADSAATIRGPLWEELKAKADAKPPATVYLDDAETKYCLDLMKQRIEDLKAPAGTSIRTASLPEGDAE